MPDLANSQILPQPLPLVCYANTVYERLDTHYREVDPEKLKTRVTKFLTTQGLTRLSKSLVDNTIACIKAECLLEGDRPLPFYTEFDSDSDGRLEQRKYLALRNGLIEIDELERGIHPSLIPHTPNWVSTTVLPYSYARDAQSPNWLAFLGEALSQQREGDRRIRLL